jgi:hypothetical protein
VSASTNWQHLVTAPAPGRHIAQLYSDPGFLARAVGRFVAEGLRAGEAAILISTPAHWQAIGRQLEAAQLAVDDLRRRGQLTVLDAAECLAEFLVDGVPDRVRFHALVGGLVRDTRARGYQRIRAFGEMVDLLCRTAPEATIRLEELWGEALAAHGISLLCGYSFDTFDPRIYRGLLQRVSGVHTDLVPAEDYAQLERAVALAYVEVFGFGGEPAALRQSFLAHYTRPAAMPDAQAAILALSEFVPTSGDQLLERVRHHYRAADPSRPAA